MIIIISQKRQRTGQMHVHIKNRHENIHKEVETKKINALPVTNKSPFPPKKKIMEARAEFHNIDAIDTGAIPEKIPYHNN